MSELNDIILNEMEATDPELKKKRKMAEFRKRSDILISNSNKDELFKTLRTLYSLCDWLLNDLDHEERKKLIKEVCKDVNNSLVDELVDLIADKKLYSKKTNWKKFKYCCRRCFRRRDQNDNY